MIAPLFLLRARLLHILSFEEMQIFTAIRRTFTLCALTTGSYVDSLQAGTRHGDIWTCGAAAIELKIACSMVALRLGQETSMCVAFWQRWSSIMRISCAGAGLYICD